MRHRKNNIRLGRKSAHRKATMQSMARALLAKESITTTKVKAKEAQSFIESLITIAKASTPEAKRRVFAQLKDKDLISLLFNEIAPRFKSRNGGYTRIIPIYPRRGDGSPMAILELVEKKAKVAPKKLKKEEPKKKKVEAKKEEPKKVAPPKVEEPKKEHVAPEPKADVKEEIQKEKGRTEEKKIKKGGLFKNIRRYFRGKAP